jgi:hypothetical protein
VKKTKEPSMMKKNRLPLEQLQLTSFITTDLQKDNRETLKGGNAGTTTLTTDYTVDRCPTLPTGCNEYPSIHYCPTFPLGCRITIAG